MKKYISFILTVSLVTVSKSEQKEILNPQLYNVWVIEDLALNNITKEGIEYYVSNNPEDSLKKIESSDKIIVIVSKKDESSIFQIRYGRNRDYQILDKKQVEWVLAGTLRERIMEKNYYYIVDDSYIRNSQNNAEKEYFFNESYWTSSDIHLSFGSHLVNRFIYRLKSSGFVPISGTNAISLEVGNELLGYPGESKGMWDLGLLAPYYEIGLQMPTMDLLGGENAFHKRLSVANNSYLQGAFGGYGNVSLNNIRVELGFADVDGNNKLVNDNIRDSTFVDFMNLSVLASYDVNFQKPFLKLGYLKGMLGAGYYEISHRSLGADSVFVVRYQKKDGELYSGSKSNFAGLMIRGDFITPINKNNRPLLHLYAQVNAYRGNRSWQTGARINIKNLALGFTYKDSIDKVDWAPDNEYILSIIVNR